MYRRLSAELDGSRRSRKCNRARHSHVPYDPHLPVRHLDDLRVDEASLFALAAGTAGGNWPSTASVRLVGGRFPRPGSTPRRARNGRTASGARGPRGTDPAPARAFEGGSPLR